MIVVYRKLCQRKPFNEQEKRLHALNRGRTFMWEDQRQHGLEENY